jgi:hypothetical protein
MTCTLFYSPSSRVCSAPAFLARYSYARMQVSTVFNACLITVTNTEAVKTTELKEIWL